MVNPLNDFYRLVLALGLGLLGADHCLATDSTYVRFSTSLGNIDVQMLSDEAPKNVANFMSYVRNGSYNNTFIHRAIPGFIIQGGGFFWDGSGNLNEVAQIGNAVQGEPGVSNQRGTLAMALQSVDVASGGDSQDTGTTNWFFNLGDNSALDTAQQVTDSSNGQPAISGAFTVFGVVANSSSLAVMDALSNVPNWNFGSPFDTLPLQNYSTALYNAYFNPQSAQDQTIPLADFVYVNSITTLTTTNYAAWQTAFQTDPNAAIDSLPTAMPQKDGVTNLLKYVCDVTPNVPMTPTERAKLPTVSQTTISGVKTMVFTYRQRANLVGAFVTVQTSTDLSPNSWAAPTNATTTQTATTDGTNDVIMQVQVPAPATGATFIRLQVTQ